MKWIDVLTFNEKNEPIFGGPFSVTKKIVFPSQSNTGIVLNLKKVQEY
jgi:hypothetical protein